MRKEYFTLLKKDLQLLYAGKFLVLVLGALILYSFYIHFVYLSLDQPIYPVYLWDPDGRYPSGAEELLHVDSKEELMHRISDGYAVGIDATREEVELMAVSSDSITSDYLRKGYAYSLLCDSSQRAPEIIGRFDREYKQRREIISEFLFFELTAVGFLGIASVIYKEKNMGVMRVHAVLPMRKAIFLLSKLTAFLIVDCIFAGVFTFIHLRGEAGLSVLPAVLLQTFVLSLIMALIGFVCAVRLPDFKQFSLLYLVLAVFITTPVFLAAQTHVHWTWIAYHPMYHLFLAMKNAYFQVPQTSILYYLLAFLSIGGLFILSYQSLSSEMGKGGQL